MNEQISRLMQWMDGKKPGPYSLEFFADVGCNLYCKFCDPDKKEIRGLDFKVASKILEEAKELDVKVIRVIGIGDPFIKPEQMTDLMQKIKNYNMFGYTVTNGTLFNEGQIERIVRMKWNEIRISLHGPDAKTHDYLVGLEGAFDTVMKNINLFNYYKRKFKTDLPRIRINFVLNKINYPKIIEMISLCKKINCDFVLLPLEVPDIKNHRFLKNLVLDEKDKIIFSRLAQEAKRKFSGSGIEVMIPYADGKVVIDKIPKNEENLSSTFKQVSYQGKKTSENKRILKTQEKKPLFVNSKCFDPWLNITIKDYEVFGVCCPSVSYIQNMIFKKENPENKKYKTLKEIWFSDYFEKIRKDIIMGKVRGFCYFCCNTDSEWISENLINGLKNRR